MTILRIDSSILGDNSVSRQLTAEVAAREAARTGGDVVHRDLAAEPLSHLSGASFAWRALDAAARTPEQQAEIDAGDRALDEFLGADVVVVGAPMYNFAIPSQLKAWVDRIAVAGRTFRYTEAGPEGLAKGKKVIVVSSRGGVYSDGPAAVMDHQESYLKALFGFLGVEDVEIIRAEGVNLGEAAKAASIAGARALIAGGQRLAA